MVGWLGVAGRENGSEPIVPIWFGPNARSSSRCDLSRPRACRLGQKVGSYSSLGAVQDCQSTLLRGQRVRIWINSLTS